VALTSYQVELLSICLDISASVRIFAAFNALRRIHLGDVEFLLRVVLSTLF
jgi:hypothetical protein